MTLSTRLTLFAAILCAAGVLCYCYWTYKCRPLLNERNDLLERQAILISSNRIMQIKTDDLKERQHRFQTDPEYVKLIAHENNQLEADEVLYHFPDETKAPAKK